MPVIINDQEYHRTGYVCSIVGISRNTLFSWLQRGVLGETELRDRRGWRLFREDELEALKAEAKRTITVIRGRI